MARDETCDKEKPATTPCPKCGTDVPAPAKPSVRPDEPRTPEPEDALRADAPPAPCPQCGWSTMWNE